MFRALVIVFATFFALPLFVLAQSAVADRQAALQAQLDQLETQIAGQQALLDTAQGQHRTLQSQIDILDAEIKKTELQIKAINVSIEQLQSGIGADNATLAKLSAKLASEKESLSEIMRKTQMLDDFSAVSVALSAESVSSFFKDLDTFAAIQNSLANSFEEIARTSSSTEQAKETLQAKLAEQQELQTEAKLAKQQVLAQEKEKQRLLTATKGQEAAYQTLIAVNQKTAGQIRAELFNLRDSAAIPFGQALAYAQAAEKVTGTRAAVTLGVLKQETNLGENLGTGSWRVDMNPSRDQPVFSFITQALGLDPDKMPVSKKPSYGWGGAMGPGQFIPSTWVCFGGFINSKTGKCTPSGSASAFWQGPWQYVAEKDRVRTLTGNNSISNPWNARDAITATAMLMADNGAGTQIASAERLAALRYFAGANATKRAYAFYGDGVMEYAAEFQQQIDILNRS